MRPKGFHVPAVWLPRREAEPLYRRAVAGGETQLGRDHRSTLMWVNNLANLLESQGKLDEAGEWGGEDGLTRFGGFHEICRQFPTC